MFSLLLGVVWIAAMTVGSPMLFVQQLEVRKRDLFTPNIQF